MYAALTNLRPDPDVAAVENWAIDLNVYACTIENPLPILFREENESGQIMFYATMWYWQVSNAACLPATFRSQSAGCNCDVVKQSHAKQRALHFTFRTCKGLANHSISLMLPNSQPLSKRQHGNCPTGQYENARPKQVP